MNVFDTVRAAKPVVEPMPGDARRQTRESLFGTGFDDASRSINERSASGAVVSTAPHGMRVPRGARSRITASSIAKAVAGVAVLGAGGLLAWSALPSEDSTTEAGSTASSQPATESTEVVPTSVPVVSRTGVTRGSPLLLPATLLSVDEVNVSPPSPGSSSALLQTPDGDLLWLAEFDGPATAIDDAPPGEVGSIEFATYVDGPTAAYRFPVPCGTVLLNDAPGREPLRQAVIDLFLSMSIDNRASIDATLPSGWSVFDVGASATSYSAQFQVPVESGTAPVQLSQIPNGSLAQLAFGGRQLASTQFLGSSAWIDRAPFFPDSVSVFWKDEDTVFNASSGVLSFEELESFIGSMKPASSNEWRERFGLPVPVDPPVDETCGVQPSLGPTLNP